MALTADQSRLLKVLAQINGMNLESVTAVLNIAHAQNITASLADKLEMEKPKDKTAALFMLRELQGVPL